MFKIRNKEKVFKTIIYTVLVLNILSFLDVTTSESKFKEEKKDALSYTTALYLQENTEIVEEVKNDTIVINDIKVIDNDIKYYPDSKAIFLEYSITSNIYNLNYDDINKSMKFEFLDDVVCKSIKDVSKDNKGIVSCYYNGTDTNFDFKNVNNKLFKISASDIIVEESENKRIITNLTITGNANIDAEYTSIIERLESDITLTVSSNPLSYEELIDELSNYNINYAEKAKEIYIINNPSEAGKDIPTAPFGANISDIESYIKKYTDINNWTLNGKNIPGLYYEEIKIGDDIRYIYKLEDNFIGYIKTYNPSNDAKKMYFTTNDGKSFTDEENSKKWQDIFEEYLEYFFKDEKENIIKYINEKYLNGILDILKMNSTESVNELIHLDRTGAIEISDSTFDYIYNYINKDAGKIRVSLSAGYNMYTIYYDNLNVVYDGKLSKETIESLWSDDNSNINLAKADEIYYKINDTSANIIDKYTGVIIGLGSDDGKQFNVRIYSDDKYNWFTIEEVTLSNDDTSLNNNATANDTLNADTSVKDNPPVANNNISSSGSDGNDTDNTDLKNSFKADVSGTKGEKVVLNVPDAVIVEPDVDKASILKDKTSL